jgi:hypothetical protein
MNTPNFLLNGKYGQHSLIHHLTLPPPHKELDPMSEPYPGLAEYQSVKRMHAGEITEVVPAGCYVRTATGDGVLLEYPPSMTARYTPVPGDFWVIYPGDGYQSISPRQAFLDGYLPTQGA